MQATLTVASISGDYAPRHRDQVGFRCDLDPCGDVLLRDRLELAARRGEAVAELDLAATSRSTHAAPDACRDRWRRTCDRGGARTGMSKNRARADSALRELFGALTAAMADGRAGYARAS